jgi:RNA polymerase sigma factor (sigma-70 family)
MYHQDWPAPLSGEQQLELCRQMAQARHGIRYARIWAQAACRVQSLEGGVVARRAMRRAVGRYEQIRNRLWETSMRLVVYWAGRYAGRACSAEDLISLGAVRLQYAIERFDPGRGVQFSTYCTVALQRDFARAVEQAGRRLSRERSLGVPGEDMRAWESLLGTTAPGDYDQPSGDERLLEEIRLAIADLPARERGVVFARCERETLPVIAGRMGKSKERVRQLEARALGRVADKIGGGKPLGSLAKV